MTFTRRWVGERFLPRPTTTFTKRRLYCGVEREEEGRQRRDLAQIRAAYVETLQILAGWWARQHADASGNAP